MIETVDLVLTGARAGKTVKLNNKQFVDGVLRLRGSHEQLAPVLSYYGRCYAAFAAGTPELAEHQALDKERLGGQHKVDAPPGSGPAAGLERPVGDGSTGGATPPGATINGAGDGSQAGREGLRPGGDGHADAGLRAGQVAQQQGQSGTDDLTKVRHAVLALDPAVAENWNAEGKARVEAVAAYLNDQTITRRQIDAAAGDLDRGKVAENRAKQP